MATLVTNPASFGSHDQKGGAGQSDVGMAAYRVQSLSIKTVFKAALR